MLIKIIYIMGEPNVKKVLFFDNEFDFSHTTGFGQNLPFESKIIFTAFSYRVFFINLTGS